MNIRIKLKVSKNSKVKIEKNGLVIYVDKGNTYTIDEGTNTRPGNIGDRDIARENELTAFHIICNQYKAEKLYYLITLKRMLKDLVASEKGEWNIIIKNIDQTGLKWGADRYLNVLNRYHLYLSSGDSLIEKTDLVINPTNINNLNPINQTDPSNNLDRYKNQLFQLNDLLDKLNDFFIEDQEFDISLHTSLENDINELQSYVNNSGPDIPEVDAKKTIYNIVNDNIIASNLEQKQIFKIKIDNWIDKLKEYRVWHQVIGLNKNSEILTAKKKGVTILGKAGSPPSVGLAITSKDLDLNSLNIIEIKKSFPKPDGKYKNFLISDPQYPKIILIDFFRDKKFFGSTINNIDYSKETEPNKCRGFNPKDFSQFASSPYASYGNHQNEYMSENDGQIVETGIDNFPYSKMVIDAWIAPDIDKAIDLLFFGIPYENMISRNTRRYDVNDDKCLLYFNEIEESGLTKSKILKGYYNALKHHKCGSKANLGTEDWTSSNYHNDLAGKADGAKKKVEDNYLKIKEFIEIFEKDYQSYQFDKMKELTEAKIKLFNYYLLPATMKSDPAYKKINEHWKKKIEIKISEIDARTLELTGTLPDNSEFNKLVEKELAAEIDKNENEKDKRIVMKNSMKNSNYLFLYEAVEIMKKFTEVKGATKKDTTKLTHIKELKANKINGWGIINNYKHTDGSGYADYRLKLYEDIEEEPKTPEEKQIEFLTNIWSEDFVDEASFKAKIDNADENVINAAEKEKLKTDLLPRKKLAKHLESKNDEAKKLIDLLKYFRPDYSGKNLSNKTKKNKLEKQLKDLKEYTKSGTSQNSVFTNDLEDSEKEVVKNLIKEIQAKVAEMRKSQEENPPKKGPSASDTPWASILIVASVVLGLVGLIVYFGQRRKDSEENEEFE